jgi:ethanolamine-phosphate cytidylyltransferase
LSFFARYCPAGCDAVLPDSAWTQARALGEYLLVGVYADDLVKDLSGSKFPIMSLHERALSLVGCRYVDDVLIGAPRAISLSMLETFRISTVLHEYHEELNYDLGPVATCQTTHELYCTPIALGIYQRVDPPLKLSIDDIAGRILAHRGAYEQRIQIKTAEYASTGT